MNYPFKLSKFQGGISTEDIFKINFDLPLALWGVNAFVSYLRPITCPVKIPPVMKMEVPMDMAPRRARGAISPIYRGCTQIAIPVIQMRCQLWEHKQMLIMLCNLINSISISFMFSHLTDRLHAIYHKSNNKFHPANHLQKFKTCNEYI